MLVIWVGSLRDCCGRPFGLILVFFQSSGVVPWCSEARKIKLSAGLISGVKSFIGLVGILSGPAAMCGLRRLRIFWTPA